MPEISEQAIRDRLKTAHAWITPVSKANYFSSAINTDRKRNIVDISFEGVGANSVGLYRLEADTTTSTLVRRTQVPASTERNLNNNYNIKSPILVLPGGTNLQGLATGNSISSTVTYWDDELV